MDVTTDEPMPGADAMEALKSAGVLDEVLAKIDAGGRQKPEALMERMQPHLLSASEGTVASKALAAKAFTEQLSLLNTHLRAHDRRLGELLDVHPDTPIFMSFPGIGPVTAAVLISEMGEARNRSGSGHQGLRAHTAGSVPLRRQPPHATRH